jgi:hypothetical protein
MSARKLTCALIAIAIGHVAYTLLLYRVRVLTHSAIASSDFILFGLPAILAFTGYWLLLRGRQIRMIPPWMAACLLVFISFWLSLFIAFNIYGT